MHKAYSYNKTQAPVILVTILVSSFLIVHIIIILVLYNQLLKQKGSKLIKNK